MSEWRKIDIGPGLVFDALAAGPDEAPLVLLLHGFAQSLHAWRAQLPALAAAGYRAVAPSQRGYSPGARPDVTDVANYRFDLLVADALAIVAACGHAEGRFHLVGHDWGGSIAWGIADRYPQRVASLTVLSRPHPNAFNRALQMADGEQARRSRHHRDFLEPDAGSRVLADDARWLRERLARSGVPAKAIAEHLSVLGNPAAMEAALAWYRARGAIARRSARSGFRRFTCGATRTIPSGGRRPRARASSCPHPIASRCCPASAISSPTRRPTGSTNCCWRTWRSTRSRSAGLCVWASPIPFGSSQGLRQGGAEGIIVP